MSISIGEAILVNENEVRVAEVNDLPLTVKAFKLGIEALKRVKLYKEAHIGLHYTPMPGETEE